MSDLDLSVAGRQPTGQGSSYASAAQNISKDTRLWLPIVLAICMTAASLTPVWLPEHFPSQNGPWFLSMVHMYKNLNNPQYNYSDFYERAWQPIPHLLNSVLVYGVSHAVPLLVAEKLALSVYLILLPLSLFYFMSVVAPDRRILAFLGYLMVHTYSFYRGYFNFSLSIPLFFFAFAYWIRHRETAGTRQKTVLPVLATLVYFSHLVAFAMLVFCIGFYRLLETRSVRKAGAAVIWGTWPGWIFFTLHANFSYQNAEWIQPTSFAYKAFHTTVENFVRKYFYTVSFPAYMIAVAPWLWVVYLIGRRLDWLKSGLFTTLKSTLRNPLLTLVGTLVVIYLVLPWQLLGWHPFNARMLPFIFGLTLGCAGKIPTWHRPVHFQTAFLTTVCGSAIAVYALLTVQALRIDSTLAQCLEGVNQFEPNSILLPLFSETPQFGQVRPLRRAYEYYHIAKGGANGYGIGKYNTIVPLVYRTFPIEQVFPDFDEESPETSLRVLEDVYDYVLVWGQDEKFLRYVDRSSFRMVFQNDQVRLFRNDSRGHRSAKKSNL